jgi:rare lipoprotein A
MMFLFYALKPFAPPPRLAIASLQMRVYKAAAVTAVLILILTATACRKKVRTAKPPKIGSTEVGVASWYGYPYHGRRAANGEIYDMEKLTAAHRTLPFNTWVRVENLSNRKKVEVRIQDRGPFVRGRIIDLSKAGARQIDMIGPGTTKVRLTVIAPPKNLEKQPEMFAVQVGAFQDRAKADSLRAAMGERYGPVSVVAREGDKTIWRVLVGETPTLQEAQSLADEIRTSGSQGFVVRLDSATR